MYASMEELVYCGNCDLKNGMRTLALPIATSMAATSNNSASLFGGNASSKCSRTCYLTYLSFYWEPVGYMQVVLHHVWCG